MDAAENTTLTAEMLANIAGTTKVLEDMRLGLLEDAIHVEELGLMKPADECAEHATCLPSILRDQIVALQQKDPAIVRLRHYLELERKPTQGE